VEASSTRRLRVFEGEGSVDAIDDFTNRLATTHQTVLP
jgi:hypothetical protein